MFLSDLFILIFKGFLAGLCGTENKENKEKTIHMDMTCKMDKTG